MACQFSPPVCDHRPVPVARVLGNLKRQEDSRLCQGLFPSVICFNGMWLKTSAANKSNPAPSGLCSSWVTALRNTPFPAFSVPGLPLHHSSRPWEPISFSFPPSPLPGPIPSLSPHSWSPALYLSLQHPPNPANSGLQLPSSLGCVTSPLPALKGAGSSWHLTSGLRLSL